MNIYDNNYLGEEELEQLSTQNLIDLAISNFMGIPVGTILPDTIYKYELSPESDHITLLRFEYTGERETDPQRDILWDDFINHKVCKDPDMFGTHKYTIKAYRNRKGFISSIPPGLDICCDIPIAAIHNKNLRESDQCKNILYTLDIIDDREVRARLEKQKGK